MFIILQGLKHYVNAPFNISDGVYGSCFYLATGFHGFHVFIGTLALTVSFVKIVLNYFTNKQFIGIGVLSMSFGCFYFCMRIGEGFNMKEN